MTKHLGTLIDDIKNVILQPHEFSEGSLKALGESIARDIGEQINPEKREPTLRMSNVGTKCNRKLWLDINHPELKAPYPFQTRMTFMMGTVLENILMFLVKEAGHKVEGEQDELEVAGIKGHRDAVIDGVLVDVKSASSRSFEKFQGHLSITEDGFGYLDQLGSYLEASQGDDKVTEKEKAAFLVIDKQYGTVALDIHNKGRTDYKAFMEMKKKVASSPTMPPRGFKDKEAASPKGNKELCFQCNYCDFRRACWPGLRTFGYENGKRPRAFTHVKTVPNVPEIETPGYDLPKELQAQA